MDSLAFCYWLQGFMEIEQPAELCNDQITIIKDHLQAVFNKVTPDRSVDKKLEDLYKYPHCGSTQIHSDLNVRSYCVDNTILKYYPGVSC